AGKAHRPGLVGERAADAIDQRRLARAIRPDQPDALTGRHRKIDAVERDEAAEALAQIADVEQRVRHGTPLRVAGASGAAPCGLSSNPPASAARFNSTATSHSQGGPGTKLAIAPAAGRSASERRPTRPPRMKARYIRIPQKMIS